MFQNKKEIFSWLWYHARLEPFSCASWTVGSFVVWVAYSFAETTQLEKQMQVFFKNYVQVLWIGNKNVRILLIAIADIGICNITKGRNSRYL